MQPFMPTPHPATGRCTAVILPTQDTPLTKPHLLFPHNYGPLPWTLMRYLRLLRLQWLTARHLWAQQTAFTAWTQLQERKGGAHRAATMPPQPPPFPTGASLQATPTATCTVLMLTAAQNFGASQPPRRVRLLPLQPLWKTASTSNQVVA